MLPVAPLFLCGGSNTTRSKSVPTSAGSAVASATGSGLTSGRTSTYRASGCALLNQMARLPADKSMIFTNSPFLDRLFISENLLGQTEHLFRQHGGNQ